MSSEARRAASERESPLAADHSAVGVTAKCGGGRCVRSRARQGGWLGLVVMLVALVIVALLAKEALKQYGLLPGNATAARAATPGERTRAAGAVGIDAAPLDSAPQAPSGALDRARGLEEMVQRQADDRAKRMDGAQ